VHGGVCKTACAFGTGRISGMLYCVRAFGGLVVALSFGFLCTFCSDPGFILVFVFVLSMWTLKLGKEVCNVCGFGFGLDHLWDYIFRFSCIAFRCCLGSSLVSSVPEIVTVVASFSYVGLLGSDNDLPRPGHQAGQRSPEELVRHAIFTLKRLSYALRGTCASMCQRISTGTVFVKRLKGVAALPR